MEITDVQVKLIGNGDDRLKASCTLVIDGEFVIRDVKVIERTNGLFVAMPSRKLTDHCPKCGHKNHLRSRYCNHCGNRLGDNRWTMKGGVAQLHAEIAHPINRDCRERVHKQVIEAYETERREFNESGRTRHYDYDDDRPDDDDLSPSARSFNGMEDDDLPMPPRRRPAADDRGAGYAPSSTKDTNDTFGKGLT
jgi:stage V sporulation protein G